MEEQKPPSYCQNKHIQINDLDELNKLDSIEFDKVIFLIGSSNHHDININIDMGIDFNVYPLNKALGLFLKKKSKKVYLFYNNPFIRSKKNSYTC